MLEFPPPPANKIHHSEMCTTGRPTVDGQNLAPPYAGRGDVANACATRERPRHPLATPEVNVGSCESARVEWCKILSIRSEGHPLGLALDNIKHGVGTGEEGSPASWAPQSEVVRDFVHQLSSGDLRLGCPVCTHQRSGQFQTEKHWKRTSDPDR